MKLLPDQQRVKTLLSDTITLLCKNGLNYSSEFCIDALIGITVDQSQVFLVNINETIGKDLLGKPHIKNRKRRIVENGSGLQNGDHMPHTGVSKNKTPKLQNNSQKHLHQNKDDLLLVDDRNTFNDKPDLRLQDSDLPTVPLTGNIPSPSNNSKGGSESKHNNNNEKTRSPVEIKEEVTDSDNLNNDSELAMQLLYGSEVEDSNKSDFSNLEHQVTGPPVWPEPTLSFSSGLTLPTVIAPSQSGGCDPDSPTHSTDEAGGQSGQVNLSQMMGRRRSSRLVHEGYKYHKNRQGPDPGKTYWRCSNRKCPGRIILFQGKITIRGQHNHPASLTDWPINKYPEEVEETDTTSNNILPLVSNHIDNIKTMMERQQQQTSGRSNQEGIDIKTKYSSQNNLRTSSFGHMTVVVEPTVIQPIIDGDIDDEQLTMDLSCNEDDSDNRTDIYSSSNSYTLGPPVFPSQIN